MTSLAGRPPEQSQRGELDFWQRYPESWNLHLSHYLQVFLFSSLDYDREILDLGSGPRSVFEEVAPPHARIVPCDTLADGYNRLIPDKRFPVVASIPPRKFHLITMFNMLDHMDRPEELLAQTAQHLEDDGELWLYAHLDRPFGSEEHPQCFRFWQVAPLIEKSFTIKTCGLYPEAMSRNAFWCVCSAKRKGRPIVSLVHRARLRVCASFPSQAPGCTRETPVTPQVLEQEITFT